MGYCIVDAVVPSASICMYCLEIFWRLAGFIFIDEEQLKGKHKHSKISIVKGTPQFVMCSALKYWSVCF